MTCTHSDIIVHGYLIAGGRSRRMGIDKRLMVFQGKKLLERSFQVLEATLGVSPSVVGDNPVKTECPEMRWLPDALPGCGPLGGLVSALRNLVARYPGANLSNLLALVLPIDMPAITPDDLNKLLLAVQDEEHLRCKKRQMPADCHQTPAFGSQSGLFDQSEVFCLGVNNRPEPLVAIYRASSLSYWSQRLSEKQYSLLEGFEYLPITIIPPEGGLKALWNINTRMDVNIHS